MNAPATALSSLSPIFSDIDQIIIQFGPLDQFNISVYPPRDGDPTHFGGIIISVTGHSDCLYLHASASDPGDRCHIEEEQEEEVLSVEESCHEFSSSTDFVDYLSRRIREFLTAQHHPVPSLHDWTPKSARCKELAQYAESRSGALLGVHEDGIRPVYVWQCDQSHRFNARGRTAKQWWCPDCRNIQRSAETLRALREIDENFDGVLLDWSFTNLSMAYDWLCVRGHKFRASARIVQRDGCTVCKEDDDNRRRRDERAAIAELRGGRLLDKEVTPYQGPNLWACKNGHKFTMTLAQARISWCPECIDTKTNTLGFKKLRDIAKSRNGALLSQSFDLKRLEYRWRCSKGHLFELNWLKADDTWCPRCTSRGSTSTPSSFPP